MTDSFFIRHNRRYEKIRFRDICYLESAVNYCKIHTVDRVHLVLCPLKRIESLLPPGDFCRIHRAFVISLDKLTGFDRCHAWLPNRDPLPVSEHYFPLLKKKLLLIEQAPVNGSILHLHPAG